MYHLKGSKMQVALHTPQFWILCVMKSFPALNSSSYTNSVRLWLLVGVHGHIYFWVTENTFYSNAEGYAQNIYLCTNNIRSKQEICTGEDPTKQSFFRKSGVQISFQRLARWVLMWRFSFFSGAYRNTQFRASVFIPHPFQYNIQCNIGHGKQYKSLAYAPSSCVRVLCFSPVI